MKAFAYCLTLGRSSDVVESRGAKSVVGIISTVSSTLFLLLLKVAMMICEFSSAFGMTPIDFTSTAL